MTPLVELRGVSKRFGGARALIDVDLRIEPGEVHGFLGQNGSGKSTLLKVLSGFHDPDAGCFRESDGATLTPASAETGRTWCRWSGEGGRWRRW